MKLQRTAPDTHPVDARTRDNTRTATDPSSNDTSPPFDGVLADVQSGAKISRQDDLPAAKAIDGALAADTAAKPAADPASDNTLIDAFIGILGQGVGASKTSPDAAAKDKAKPESLSGKSDSEAVDSLLKRAVADDETAASAAAVTPQPSTDLMSILLFGSAQNKAPQIPPVVTSAGETAASKAAVADALGGSEKSPPTDPKAKADGDEVIVSDISIISHPAPVAAMSTAALPQDQKNAAKPVLGLASMIGSGTPRPQPDDTTLGVASATQHHDTAPSVDVLTAQPMPTTHAAVRSIAAAIGDLAAATQPTVAAAETPKAALGPARTMTLQMSPAELGTVDVRLHMTGQTLDVQLTISKAETLGMVSRERDTLKSALGDQNYQLNSLVIQDGGAGASSGGQNATTQGDTNGSNARTDRQGAGAGSNTSGDGRAGRDAERPMRDDRRQDHRDPAPRPNTVSGGGSLYV